MEFFVTIRDGQIMNRQRIRKAFDELKNGTYQVKIESGKRRSNSQNRFYWLLLTEYIQPALYDLGFREIKTKEDAHAFCAAKFLKKMIVNEDTGEVLGESVRSTSKLTTVEWEAYREDLNQFASEYLGIILPEPNQQLTMYE